MTQIGNSQPLAIRFSLLLNGDRAAGLCLYKDINIKKKWRRGCERSELPLTDQARHCE